MKIFDKKKEEEERRNRHFDLRQRWIAIQDAISWADAQQKEPRNSRENRLKEQAKKNHFLQQFENFPFKPLNEENLS